MSTVYLFVWSIIAMNNYSIQQGWINLGAFDGGTACTEAATTLGYKPDKFRCIYKGSGKAV